MRSLPTTLGHRVALAGLALVCSAGRVRGQAAGDSAAAPQVPPLFASYEPLEIRLTADFDAIAKERGETKHDHPGVLAYVGPAGDTVSIDVQLHTRGHFRLRECKYPPLKVDWAKGQKKGTVFARQPSLKLAVQCRGGDRYANYLLEEYLLYRAYNLLTDRSFRVRLARVTYVDTDKPDEAETRVAFFLEDDDRLARRSGGEVFEHTGIQQLELDPEQMGLVAVFEYMIGNTDWSVVGLHNILLIQDTTRNVFPVPYDFDWSGVIAPPYARPDSRLGITSVRQRLFRAVCRTPEDLAPIFEIFKSHKDSIYALYRAQSWLDPKRAERAIDYYDDFYKIIDNPGRVRRAIALPCPRP